MRHYTFRLRILNLEDVQAFLYDPERNDLGQPIGKFNYADFRVRIEGLREAARQQAAGFADLNEGQVCELGESLFNSLFDDVLRLRLDELVRKAMASNSRVRLEVEVEETRLPQIAVLPWEFMRIPDKYQMGVQWLGTSGSLILARRQRRDRRPPDLKLGPGEGLRIALAVSAPANPGNDGVTLGKVNYKDISNVLQDLLQPGRQVEILPLVIPATKTSLSTLFKQSQPPHIFHFIGHGRLVKDQSGREISQIALTKAGANTPDWISGDEFTSLFDHNHRPRVVVMQACESAQGSPKEAFVSTAAKVLNMNIPVVVAMQYEIKNYVARDFMTKFYGSLADLKPVDQAVQDGRVAIAEHAPGHKLAAFATPVLYLCVEDSSIQVPGPEMIGVAAEDSARVYDALLELDYEAPGDKFWEYINSRTHNAGAVVIGGPTNSEPLWLMKRLGRMEPPGLASNDFIQGVNFGRLSESCTVESLWREFAANVRFAPSANGSMLSGGTPAEPFAHQVARHIVNNQWTRQNVVLIFQNVDSSLVPGLLNDFWLPLEIAAQAREKASDYWLILFIVLKSNSSYRPGNLPGEDSALFLDAPASISPATLLKWMQTEKRGLRKLADLNDQQLRQMHQEFIQNPTDPRSTMGRLWSKLADMDYDEGVGTWRKF